VRPAGTPLATHRSVRLRRWPERRVCHALRLADGTWCANLHAQVHSPERAQADIDRAAATLLDWADGAPALLGGDFNVRVPKAAGLSHLAGHGVDHIAGRGLRANGAPLVLPRGELSDHAPISVTLLPQPRREAS